MMNQKEGSITKQLGKYITLSVLGMLGLSCYILADTFFVARGLGARGLTALNLAISVYSFIHGTGLMLGIGGATKYTILKAQNKNKDADNVFMQTVLLGFVIGMVYFVIGAVGSESLARILGADKEVFQMTNTYLKTIICFSPCFILNNVFIAFVRNDGNPRLSMAGMLIGSLSNIILDYIFIFWLGMGMFGAAFATGLAPVISMAVLSLHKIKKRNNFHIRKITANIKIPVAIVKMGAPALINEISSGITLIIFNLIILSLAGNTGVAAYGIVANLALVAISIFTGIGQGIQPVVSQNYGEGNQTNLTRIIKFSLKLSVIVSISLYILVSAGASPVVAAFNGGGDTELSGYAVTGLRLYFIGFIFAGINVITASFFSAVERVKQAFVISMMRGCVILIPMAFLLSWAFQMTGIWLAFFAAELVTCAVSLLSLRKK